LGKAMNQFDNYTYFEDSVNRQAIGGLSCGSQRGYPICNLERRRQRISGAQAMMLPLVVDARSPFVVFVTFNQ